MKAMIVFERDTFVGDIVSWNLEYKGHGIDLGKVHCARLGTHFGDSYILFKDNTHLAVSEHGLFRKKLSIQGTITLHISSLGKDLSFDIGEVEDSFIPAEDGQFIHASKVM